MEKESCAARNWVGAHRLVLLEVAMIFQQLDNHPTRSEIGGLLNFEDLASFLVTRVIQKTGVRRQGDWRNVRMESVVYQFPIRRLYGQ